MKMKKLLTSLLIGLISTSLFGTSCIGEFKKHDMLPSLYLYTNTDGSSITTNEYHLYEFGDVKSGAKIE